MNFTLFGYPKTGKTTLFNILTGAKIEVKSYDSGKKEPNLRSCPVPDYRFEKLCSLYPDKKKKPVVIEYTDLAGVSFGDVKNESYLDYLRRADGLAHVVRGFRDVKIPHPKDKIDPKDDIRSMEEEMLLADLMSVESRLEKLAKELKRKKNPEGEKEMDLMKSLLSSLEEGSPIREADLSPAEDKFSRSFAFLSQKPLFHMINVDETDISEIKNMDTPLLAFCGKVEMEILELEDEEKQLFLNEYGLKELSAPRFLKASYDLLDVITFFTVGKDEVKAWTIKKGISAVEAAGEIHSDIQQGFIRAEVIPWNSLLEHGSFQSARENAAARLEGKKYTIQDGDVIFFRFNK